MRPRRDTLIGAAAFVASFIVGPLVGILAAKALVADDGQDQALVAGFIALPIMGVAIWWAVKESER